MASTQPGPSGSAAHAGAASKSSVPAHVMVEDGETAAPGPLPPTLPQSNINTYRTSARSRTRSVGADVLQSQASSSSRPAMREKRESYRGPGTPDISLHDAFRSVKGSPEKAANEPLSEARQLSKREGHTRKRSLTDASSTSSPGRPRLTSQLRSFFTSFRTEKTDENDKGRTSDEIQDDTQRGSMAKTQKLVMPAARPAGPEGLSGFNTDSPPLTPSSDEAKELDSRENEGGEASYAPHTASHQRHHWATAQALADGAASAASASGENIEFIDRSYTPSSTTMTMSSRMSDNSSPIYSTLSRASSTNTYIPSRPMSSMSMLKMATPAPRTGILPSHSITPTGSPSPPEGAATAYLHANAPSFASVASLRLSSMMSTQQLPNLRPHLPALFFVLTAFIGSTMCVLLALSTLPLTLPRHITDLTLSEIRDMSLQLQTYSRSSNKAFAHTLAVLGFFFTWKQSFTIPGSLIMNVVFGAMYGTWMGTLITSLLTSVGGVFCYLLVAPLGSLIRKMPFLNKVLAKMQNAMTGPSSAIHHPAGSAAALPRAGRRRQASPSRGKGGNIWTYLLVLRVLPIVPYGLMNIACAVLRVPLVPYAATLALGSIPWNACTVQVGDLLVQVVSALDESAAANSLASSLDAGGFHDAVRPGGAAGLLGDKVRGKAESAVKAISAKVWNKEMLFKLLLMSLVSLAPMLLQRWLRKREADEEGEEGEVEQDRSATSESTSTTPEFDDREEEESLLMQQQQQQSASSWRSSWTCPRSNNKRLSAAVEYPESGHSKRLSEAWIEGVVSIEERLRAANRSAAPAVAASQLDIESRRHPSLKRAVASTRVE